jgi:hypothetical protein
MCRRDRMWPYSERHCRLFYARSDIPFSISFVSLISHEGVNDMLRLTFPTSIAPRYGALPGESFYRAGSLSNASTLEFSLSVEVGATITTINSPSHPISSHLGRSGPEDNSEFDVQKAFISLSSTTFLDKDIVIVLSCRNLDKQRCVVESSVSANGLDATEAYALTFVPRFKLPPLPRQEYLFLVDRSGSMEGGKMHALRSSLQVEPLLSVGVILSYYFADHAQVTSQQRLLIQPHFVRLPPKCALGD